MAQELITRLGDVKLFRWASELSQRKRRSRRPRSAPSSDAAYGEENAYAADEGVSTPASRGSPPRSSCSLVLLDAYRPEDEPLNESLATSVRSSHRALPEGWTIHDHFHAEALHRSVIRERLSELGSAGPSKPSISLESHRLARLRLEKELRAVFNEIDTEGRQSFTFKQLQAACSRLGFISHDGSRPMDRLITGKLWTLLDPEDTGYVSFATFFRVMRQLAARSGSANAAEASSVLSGDVDGLQDSMVESHVLKVLRRLYTNKLAYTPTRHLRFIPFESKLPFAPTLNEHSKQLAVASDQRFMSKLQAMYAQSPQHRYQILMHKAQELRARKESIRKELEKQELEGCTFRPAINEESKKIASLYSHQFSRPKFALKAVPSPAQLHKQESRATPLTTEEQEVQAYCTFKPTTHGSPNVSNKRHVPKGFTDFVERTRRGIETRAEKVKQLEELGKPKGKLSQSQSHCNRSTERPRSCRPRTQPIMYLKVMLPTGSSAKLAIYEDSDAHTLATTFGKIYQLDYAAQVRLETLVQTVLARIFASGASSSATAPAWTRSACSARS